MCCFRCSSALVQIGNQCSQYAWQRTLVWDFDSVSFQENRDWGMERDVWARQTVRLREVSGVGTWSHDIVQSLFWLAVISWYGRCCRHAALSYLRLYRQSALHRTTVIQHKTSDISLALLKHTVHTQIPDKESFHAAFTHWLHTEFSGHGPDDTHIIVCIVYYLFY